MPNELQQYGMSGIAGIAGIILGWFGLRARVKQVEKDLRQHKKDVVYKSQFQEFKNGLNTRLDGIDMLLQEMGRDIKELLKK
ncbi:MAG: hypothetical protein JRI33_06440 [Deltaproteobacteria bacterium]|nr:hypothetical protein [Deltaproteobacteria bacterium]